MNDKKLTVEEAYDAMFGFLKLHYERLHGDEIGALLGSMSLVEPKVPLDQAYWDDWEKCVDDALQGKIDSKLTIVKPNPFFRG